MEENKFTLETEQGTLEYEILDQIYVNQFKKNYLIYTDNSRDEMNELNIFISICKVENDKIELLDITNENELEIVADMIEKIWSK